MSSSDITKRFLTCLDKLVEEGKVKSKRHFALCLDYHAQGISEMVAHRRDAPLDLIEKAVTSFRFNPNYLFTGAGNLFCVSADEESLRLKNLTIVTDQHGEERIVHVPFTAQAGYGQLLDDTVFMQNLPSYKLPDPQFSSGTYRSFEISGTSMDPTFHSGDIVIAAFIEPRFWEQAIKNSQIYIIVTRQEVVIKRIVNRIKGERVLECISDNNEFEKYPIRAEDVIEVWKVRMKLTTHLEAPASPVNTIAITEQLNAQHKMLENLQQHITKSRMAKA